MKKTTHLYGVFLLLLCLTLWNCAEPYQLQTNTFENAIVIEASLTDELKTQQIKISRTYRFEEDGPTFETGASVIVTDDAGNSYPFQENNGVYASEAEFQAVPGRKYHLEITTSDGKSYASDQQMLTAISPIGDVTASVATNADGVRGVQIAANSFDPTASSKYYRYEYEETYKIIVPKYSPFKAIVIPDDNDPGTNPTISIEPKTIETRTCYSTVKSNNIILTSTASLSEDRVSNFPLRFIAQDNYIIGNRFSILVRQYIQNLASYTFYKTLKEIGDSGGSILSQNQPGFFYGNVRAIDNPDEKVIGFFEVSSVSSKRIFFNYTDLFPGEPPPPYFNDCMEQTFDTTDFTPPPGGTNEATRLVNYINSNQLVYYFAEGVLYSMVPTVCGDCTSFSSNVIPPFWE